MASGKKPDDKKEVSGTDLLDQSKKLCSTCLFRFQENHDLCTQSGFFSDNTVSEIDSCAIDFRVLGLETVTVAKTVSDQWLDSVIVFYQNISTLDQKTCVEMLKTLGGQAKELGLIFKVIAAWSRNLAGRIHQACIDTHTEADNAVVKFKRLVEDDTRKVQTAQAKLNAAQNRLNLARASEHKWAVALAASAWTIIGYFVSAIGLAIAEKAVSSTTAARNAAAQGLADARREYDEAESQEKKAEIIVGKAAKLVATLHAMEVTTEAIATFWTLESDVFITHSQKMIANETHYNKILLEKAVSKEDIITWEHSKTDFQNYAKDMSAIVNLFNFKSKAKEATTQEFKLDKLDMKLSIPSDIDVKKIMEGGY